jgi:hypothetical protein
MLLVCPLAANAEKPTQVTVVNPVVPVEVSNADPIPVSISGSDEAFQVGTVPTGFSGSIGSADLTTVPADKVLVVEYVSAWINVPEASGLLAVYLAGAGSDSAQLMCQPIGENSLNHIFSCGGPTKYSLQPGSTLQFGVQTFSSSGGVFKVLVSGHLEAQ